MGMLLKLIIGLIIGTVIFSYLPESTQDDIIEKGKELKEDILDNETVSETLNSTTSGEDNTDESLTKKYLGKPEKSISFDCVSDDDCVESFCDTNLGECYVYE